MKRFYQLMALTAAIVIAGCASGPTVDKSPVKQTSPAVESIVFTSALDDRNNPTDVLVEIDKHTDFFVQVRWKDLEPQKRYFVTYLFTDEMGEERPRLGGNFTPVTSKWRTWMRVIFPPQKIGNWTLSVELDGEKIADKRIVIGEKNVADANATIARTEPLFSKGVSGGSNEYGDCLLPGDAEPVTQRENLCLAAGGEFEKWGQKTVVLEPKFDEFYSGDGKEFSTTIQALRELAEQGVAEAQSNLGLMYVEGKGVIKNYTKALNWFRLAADQGFAEAQYNLGLMYTKGLGVVRDDARAFKWYRLAADQGVAQAKRKLEMMYAQGDGDCRLPGDTEPVTLKETLCLSVGGTFQRSAKAPTASVAIDIPSTKGRLDALNQLSKAHMDSSPYDINQWPVTLDKARKAANGIKSYCSRETWFSYQDDALKATDWIGFDTRIDFSYPDKYRVMKKMFDLELQRWLVDVWVTIGDKVYVNLLSWVQMDEGVDVTKAWAGLPRERSIKTILNNWGDTKPDSVNYYGNEMGKYLVATLDLRTLGKCPTDQGVSCSTEIWLDSDYRLVKQVFTVKGESDTGEPVDVKIDTVFSGFNEAIRMPTPMKTKERIPFHDC